MMRSLWSGVSGLQAHQVAMDVEGNNIANVNTVGFKYSRTNFADMLSQTSKIATAPADPLGGRNSLQVGLGATVSSVTHIFSQGSRQTTDKTTDIAIEGDGFFVVSPDNGITYKYTRAGDFTFDAYGNFVDNNGLIVQGWVKDENDKIDSTLPIKSIQIDPGLTIPAKATDSVTLSANLVSGSTTNEKSPIYALDTDSTTVASSALPNSVTNQKPEDFGALFNSSGQAYNLQNGQGMWVGFEPAQVSNAGIANDSTASSAVNVTLNGISISGTIPTGLSSSAAASYYASLINTYTSQTGVTASASGTSITYTNTNALEGDSTKNIVLSLGAIGAGFTGLAGVAATDPGATTAFKYQYGASANPATNSTSIGVTKNFHTTEDLRAYLQWQASAHSPGALVSVNSDGKYVITNPNTATGNTLTIAVTSIDGDGTVNPSPLFTKTFDAMEGPLPTGSGSSKTSQDINAAIHASSIDIFDSLGSKHTITYSFRKESQTTWSWSATVPSPADIGGIAPNQNLFQGGTVVFNSNGSLSSVNPQSMAITWNNGSSPSQQINLAFGTPGGFDGLKSFDQKSATSLISQDGYTGGDLDGIRVDQNGVLIGSFTNGRSLGLAQVSMAKFANNEGLMADGGNLFIASANSGDPTVGAAASGGRGAVFSSALEMSNVDLSKSLTQLIVIQRGYQANSKTITTSDQMLQVLLGLKQ